MNIACPLPEIATTGVLVPAVAHCPLIISTALFCSGRRVACLMNERRRHACHSAQLSLSAVIRAPVISHDYGTRCISSASPSSPVIAFVLAIVLFNFFGLWLRARIANAPIGLGKMVGMRLRKVPVGLIVDSRITAVKAGIDIPSDPLGSALSGRRQRRSGDSGADRGG